jgi:enoyl-CoA hydratase
MEIILTGVPVTAPVMERLGVVNRVVSSGEDVLTEALILARRIASFSAPAVGMAKQAVLAGEMLSDYFGRLPS